MINHKVVELESDQLETSDAGVVERSAKPNIAYE